MLAHVKVAREDSPGQYVVLAEKATLQWDQATLSLAAAQQPLAHLPLAHCTLGFSKAPAAKLIIVPLDRGPCWLCEFADSASSTQCAAALQARGVELAAAGDDFGTAAQGADEVLAALQRLAPLELERVLAAIISAHQQ
tara:strand:+ start:242 stop:658 length:417 start_codon:yes stop_codon:yes gene_type:complete